MIRGGNQIPDQLESESALVRQVIYRSGSLELVYYDTKGTDSKQTQSIDLHCKPMLLLPRYSIYK